MEQNSNGNYLARRHPKFTFSCLFPYRKLSFFKYWLKTRQKSSIEQNISVILSLKIISKMAYNVLILVIKHTKYLAFSMLENCFS